ncbi:hypothetical protein [Mobilicoccus caccae]|uniref:Uncharacterized protein n=1 Tax=Mobilicoccus caccae TaxID=1859295 RepID=A0ABQ6IX50_9MICO|nr:hypothetical protein [Mobilicoccus caccae]GMA41641.1 hypothetical protein GCM10025883_36860 [Mobilicoccus caccae]
MFTLEDIDMAEDLEFIRQNGARFLPDDIQPDGDVPGDGETDPAADAIAHPYDYLIVR